MKSNRERSKSPPQLPSGEDAIAQIHRELSKQLQQEFAQTTNLDFTNIDLSAVLKKDARALLVDEGEGVDVQVSLKDVEEFFKYLNPLGHKIRKEHVKDLIRRVNGCTEREATRKAALLMGGQEDIDAKTLYTMINETKFTQFDPIRKAYEELCPDPDGNLNVEHIKRLVEALGLASIDKKDLHLLKEVADVDHDGVISYEDFRRLALEMGQQKEDPKKTEGP